MRMINNRKNDRNRPIDITTRIAQPLIHGRSWSITTGHGRSRPVTVDRRRTVAFRRDSDRVADGRRPPAAEAVWGPGRHAVPLNKQARLQN